MRLLVCRVGGLADTLSVLPTLDALTSGLCDAEITVLCAARCAGLITMSMPGVRVITVDPALLNSPAAVLKVPALARQIGPLDAALVAPGESAAVYSLCRLAAPLRVGFACGLSKGERFLTRALPYDPLRAVPDILLDLARHLLDWPTMPLRRVAPLATPPVFADLGPEAWGGEDLPAGWDDDLPAEWGDCCGGLDPVAGGPSDAKQRAALVDFPAAACLPFDLPPSRPSQRYGVIHPGAGAAALRWGDERFAKLTPLLTQVTGLSWQMVDEETFDLMDLAALLAGAEVFVGCHSGPLQLAAAQGIPWVAIGGPTSTAWDPPWGEVPGLVVRTDLACQPCAGVNGVRPGGCQHDAACLSLITLDRVTAAVRAVLQQADGAMGLARRGMA